MGQLAYPNIDQAAMAVRRITLLPMAAAFVLFGAQAFCGTGRVPQTIAQRGMVARGAVPVEMVADASSVVTALQIQQPAWAANLLSVIVPCTLLIIIYLQSERTLQERDAREGKRRM